MGHILCTVGSLEAECRKSITITPGYTPMCIQGDPPHVIGWGGTLDTQIWTKALKSEISIILPL